MIKAIIFDMNGVIVDDEHVHELTFQEVLKRFSIRLNHKEYIDLFAWRTDKDGFLNFEKKYNIQLPIDECLKEKMRVYLELFPANKKSFPSVLGLIKRFAGKFTLALTSSSSRQEIDLIINEFSLRDYFSEIVSADDVVKGEPDPEPYLITSRKLNIEPRYCLAIEDSASGVRSAKAAGMKCVAITTTHTQKELEGANVIVEKFEEITNDLIFDL